MGEGKNIVWTITADEFLHVGWFPSGWGQHDNVKSALPVHTGELDGFDMDVNEMTVGQFREFINQSDYNMGAIGMTWPSIHRLTTIQ